MIKQQCICETNKNVTFLMSKHKISISRAKPQKFIASEDNLHD